MARQVSLKDVQIPAWNIHARRVFGSIQHTELYA